MPRLSDSALDELRTRNPTVDVARTLGAVLRRSGQGAIGSCPVCGGGRTAQRFEVKAAGQWVCAVCQDGGDVIRLVERARGLDFRGAVEWLGGTAELDPAEAARLDAARTARETKREAEAARYREEERRRLWRLWGEARPSAAELAAYLGARGIDRVPPTLRFAPDMPFYHGEIEGNSGRRRARCIHTGPAMLAAFQRPDGRFGGLHITWLSAVRLGEKATIADPDTGELLAAKKVRGSKAAGRIALAGAAAPHRLVLGEGIETVLSVWQAEGWPSLGTAYWSALDLGNMGGPATGKVAHPTDTHRNGHPRRLPGPDPDTTMPGIPIPPGVHDLVLLGDGDSDRFDTETALTRAARRHAASGRVVRVAWAPSGQDFNDVVRGRG